MGAILRRIVSTRTALFAAFFLAASALCAQTASRFLGTITAINGDTLTVKTDAGEVHQVQVPAAASLRRVEPGQKDLSSAATIQMSDLATGDRVLVRLDPDATGSTPQALQIVAIKQADVAARQQKEREDWQRRGVGGLVKSVDPASGVIVLSSGAGATAKTVTVHTSLATVLKRYAPTSVRFDDARPAPIDAIHAGDQLRARGSKNADGTEITADEVVSGSFRNISGMVVSIDTASTSVVVKDLATKKQVTIHITPEAQIRRLPERMAQILAARLKGGSAAGESGRGQWSGGAQSSGAATASGAAPPAGQRQWGGAPGAASPGAGSAGSGAPGASGAGGGQWAGQGGGGGDPQQMLSRAPTIQLSELQKGEAIMIVSTEGTSDVTAISLLAGVEPLLQAPEASRDLLANWSMGSGGAESAGAQ